MLGGGEVIMEGIIIFAILLAVYFLPTIVSHGKSFGASVTVLNFFLGWTVLGWVIALAWGVMPDKGAA